MAQKPEGMPEKTWAISNADKEKIRSLGRALTATILNEFAGEKHIPVKIVIGALQYVGDFQNTKINAIGDDFKMTLDAIQYLGLAETLEEPFAPTPEAPKPDADVEGATMRPTADALPIDSPVPVAELEATQPTTPTA